MIHSGTSLYGCGSYDHLSYFGSGRGTCLSRITELQENIQAMCAGETCTAWIANNTLHVNGHGVWNDYSYFSGIPIRISRGDKCKSLAVGEEHAMVVTQQGMLFGIGINDCGQFGANEGSRVAPRVSRVEGTAAEAIIWVSTGLPPPGGTRLQPPRRSLQGASGGGDYQARSGGAAAVAPLPALA